MFNKSLYDIDKLVGETFVSISGMRKHSEAVYIELSNGDIVTMEHPNTFSNVSIDDVCGDVEDLLNTPILKAEVITDTSDHKCTWTFYKFMTEKGWVDIRWCGTSNGYYSETCSTYIIKKNETVD